MMYPPSGRHTFCPDSQKLDMNAVINGDFSAMLMGLGLPFGTHFESPLLIATFAKQTNGEAAGVLAFTRDGFSCLAL